MATVPDKSGNTPVDKPLINGTVRIVALTQAQYNALATKDGNTLYIISDA